MTTPTQPMRKTLRVNDLALHYLEWGEGEAPPILCVHGYTGSADAFNALARQLEDRYRILALDVRGHGESAWSPTGAYSYADQVGDLAEFAKQLRLDRFVLIGTSMGGIIAMAYAAEHAERLLGLVIKDIGPDVEAGSQRITGLVGRLCPVRRWWCGGRRATPSPRRRHGGWSRCCRVASWWRSPASATHRHWSSRRCWRPSTASSAACRPDSVASRAARQRHLCVKIEPHLRAQGRDLRPADGGIPASSLLPPCQRRETLPNYLIDNACCRRAAILSLRCPSQQGRWHTLYSTVTLLARLRGWSTSVPLMTAT